MNIFTETPDSHLPDFLSQSVRRKTKLNLYQFTFKQDIKLNLLKPRDQLFSLPAINVPTKNQLLLSARRQSEAKLQLQLGSKQLHEAEQEKFSFGSIRYKSERKLPTLTKFNFELNYEDQQQQKLIRLNKDVPKLGKMQGHFRQMSEKNEIVRIKQQENFSEKKDDSKGCRSPDLNRDRLKQRCYFIRNLMLNSVNTEAANNQRANLNLLVNKLKETERRGRKSVNALDKKVEQSPSPSELRTQKIETTFKQDIIKRCANSLVKPQSKPKDLSDIKKRKKQENFVSGWNIENLNNFFEDNQF